MKRKINRIIKLLKNEGFNLCEGANSPLSYWVYDRGALVVMDGIGNYFSFDVIKDSEFNGYSLGAFDISISTFKNALEALCVALFGSYEATERKCTLHITDKAKEAYLEIMK